MAGIRKPKMNKMSKMRSLKPLKPLKAPSSGGNPPLNQAMAAKSAVTRKPRKTRY